MLIWVSSAARAQLLYCSNVCLNVVTYDKSTVFTACMRASHLAICHYFWMYLTTRDLGDTANGH